MKSFNQFIIHRNKVPINPETLLPSDPHSPSNWMDAATAEYMAGLLGPEYGVGFVLTEADPFFFLDIDSCLTPANTWSELALLMLAIFPGAYVEVSRSGRGLHIIGTGSCPPHGCKNTALGMELYTSKRYVALTGTNAIGSCRTDCTDGLEHAVATYFPFLSGYALDVPVEWTSAPCAEWNGIRDDEELIEKACRSKSAGGIFGGKCTFKQLWVADTKALAASYPSSSGDTFDRSSADAALAQHLAFWTGKNCERIKSLMLLSGLKRDKWDREDYLYRTISRASSLQKKVYCLREGLKEAPTPSRASGPTLVSGYQYLTANLQAEYFKGCVYIQDMHRIFTPDGSLLKPDQFNATYGGYVFQLDETGDKTTRKAWEAFTESQCVRYPKAQSMCFRPGTVTGALIEEEGRVKVNTYVPVTVSREKGDATPFLNHLAKVLPDSRDRGILLAYMAACVQHKGTKFQWAPLLQGTEGNGKTLFTRCVAYAVGKRYTHFPKAMDLDNKFNGWLLNKLFIGVEDVFVPDHRREILETLKPMITGGDGLEIQLKGVDQVTADVCANFMLNSNHKDAIRKTRQDRRFSIFYTAQQSESDLKRDGMDGDYFPDLYNWLRARGYAIVAEYLTTYAIPDELNPATKLHRAPITTSTQEAFSASMGGIEQEITEAVEEGRQGFAGGWISSVALEKLLTAIHATRAIPHNKRRDLLRDMGYQWHPALVQGRVNNPLPMDDNKKPRLYIRNGHLAGNLTTAGEAVRAYLDAQGDVMNSQATASFGR